MLMMTVNINDIVVKNRYRKDLGDINSLSEDIKTNGLINPITITDTNELIAGERRLEALKLLGTDLVPCHVASVDSEGALFLEYAENDERKPFTPTERYAIYEALKTRLGVAKGGQKGNKNNNKSKAGVTQPSTLSKDQKRAFIAKQGGLATLHEADELSRIVKKGTQKVKDALDSGLITRNTAYKIAKLDDKDQEKALSAYTECGDFEAYILPPSGINALKEGFLSKEDVYSICKRFTNTSKRELERAVKDKRTLKITTKLKRDEKKEAGYVTISVSPKHPYEAIVKLFDVLGYSKQQEIIDHLRSHIRKNKG